MSGKYAARRSPPKPVFRCAVALQFLSLLVSGFNARAAGPIQWQQSVLVNAVPTFADNGPDSRHIHPGRFGSQYGRLTKLENGNWLAVYTIYDNDGYKYADAHHLTGQGTALQIAGSGDNCRTWKILATLRDNNRDLDNGEIIQLPNGKLRLAARSVRWQESYRIRVWSGDEAGVTWQSLSTVDSNEGPPGSLGHPDKGVYEPDFCFLNDGSLAIFYANEKHVTDQPSFSQIVSEKISADGGSTWGEEIRVAEDTAKPSDRPGMPVVIKMANGKYLAVFEVVGSHNAEVFCKASADGKTWTNGIGSRIPGQIGGPYVAGLKDGRLLVTSNTGNVSLSDDFGATWYLNDPPAWGDGSIRVYWWLSIYEISPGEIGVVASVPRPAGGTDVRLKFGKLRPKDSREQN
ncbi:MAG TPA: sialidase family protein [Verrucomicrobiae bacterium]|jgi:hypothetical protein|nr:sialidase family protein [Verrucomicrobiae bacterium]